MLKKLTPLFVSLCAASAAFAGSVTKNGTDSAYVYQDIGTYHAVLWSSGDVNGWRNLSWSGAPGTVVYQWDLAQGGSIGRIGRDANSSGYNANIRASAASAMSVSRTVTATGLSGGFWQNIVYGYLHDNANSNWCTTEYYVIDRCQSWYNSGWTSIGSYTSDGSNHYAYKKYGANGPFWQYISFREIARWSGTVTLKNSMNKWRAGGMADHYVKEIAVGAENWNAGKGKFTLSGISIQAP